MPPAMFANVLLIAEDRGGFCLVAIGVGSVVLHIRLRERWWRISHAISMESIRRCCVARCRWFAVAFDLTRGCVSFTLSWMWCRSTCICAIHCGPLVFVFCFGGVVFGSLRCMCSLCPYCACLDVLHGLYWHVGAVVCFCMFLLCFCLKKLQLHCLEMFILCLLCFVYVLCMAVRHFTAVVGCICVPLRFCCVFAWRDYH